MSGTQFDVVGIGNAIVDVLARTDDHFLAQNRLSKGAMTIIDAQTAEELYGKMGPGVEVSGGSAANTIASIATLGGRGAFIGKVMDDQMGQVFRHDIRAVGVAFDALSTVNGAPTARSSSPSPLKSQAASDSPKRSPATAPSISSSRRLRRVPAA